MIEPHTHYIDPNTWRCPTCGLYPRQIVTGVRNPLSAPTTPDHPVSPVYGDPGGHSDGQEKT